MWVMGPRPRAMCGRGCCVPALGYVVLTMTASERWVRACSSTSWAASRSSRAGARDRQRARGAGARAGQPPNDQLARGPGARLAPVVRGRLLHVGVRAGPGLQPGLGGVGGTAAPILGGAGARRAHITGEAGHAGHDNQAGRVCGRWARTGAWFLLVVWLDWVVLLVVAFLAHTHLGSGARSWAEGGAVCVVAGHAGRVCGVVGGSWAGSWSSACTERRVRRWASAGWMGNDLQWCGWRRRSTRRLAV